MTGMNEELTVALQEAFETVRTTLSYSTNVTEDYQVTGQFLHETVICNNTSAVTVTLPARTEGARVTVIRAGTGAVTINGDGTNIVGSATKALATQYDADELIASSTEWVLT